MCSATNSCPGVYDNVLTHADSPVYNRQIPQCMTYITNKNICMLCRSIELRLHHYSSHHTTFYLSLPSLAFPLPLGCSDPHVWSTPTSVDPTSFDAPYNSVMPSLQLCMSLSLSLARIS